jgi:hypothetical protein
MKIIVFAWGTMPKVLDGKRLLLTGIGMTTTQRDSKSSLEE